jgi:hypothetical protein
MQTDTATLGGMSQAVTLAMDYDYNNNMTTLAANIGDGTATFDSSTQAFTGFTGGTDEFENTYLFDKLGDLTDITQQTQTAGDPSAVNSVTAKHVAMSYDNDQRLTGLNMYQSSGTSDLTLLSEIRTCRPA